MLCSIHFWSTVSDPICVGNHVYTHHPDPKVEMIPAQRYVSEADLRFVGTGGTGDPVKFFLTVKFWGNNANSLGNY